MLTKLKNKKTELLLNIPINDDSILKAYWHNELIQRAYKPKFKTITLNLNELKKKGKIPQDYDMDKLCENNDLLDKLIEEKIS
jgi:hypothetical protein